VTIRSAEGFTCPKLIKQPRRTMAVKIEIVLAILALMKFLAILAILAIVLSFSPLQLGSQHIKERPAGELKELYVIF
jgi:hypothetical protein